MLNIFVSCRICAVWFLLRPGRGAAYCDQFVCLSVCPRAYLWKCWIDLYETCADPYGRCSVLP